MNERIRECIRTEISHIQEGKRFTKNCKN